MVVRIPAVAATLTLLSATACTVVRSPHLYPSDEIASKTGVLEAQMVGHGNLHGTLELTMPDGELLQGEYSIVAGGAVGVGNAYASSGSASGFGTFSSIAMAGSGNGMASLYGNRGTSLHCEFQNNNLTGHGYGVCQSSKGTHYRMEY